MCIAPAACWAFWRAGPRRAAEFARSKRLGLTLPQTLEQYDVMVTQDAVKMSRAGPASIVTQAHRKTAAGIPG